VVGVGESQILKENQGRKNADEDSDLHCRPGPAEACKAELGAILGLMGSTSI
jgi:hypothetical protein